MKKFFGLSLILSLIGAVVMPVFAQKTELASAATTPTGYTKASDVKYKTVHISDSKLAKGGDYVANWGARDEKCVFLSSYATSFYTGSYSYDQMSLKAGGSSQSSAPSSALYTSLKTMMSSKQTYETSYDKTRGLYCVTDCVKSDYTTISSFYSGKEISGTWDSGDTWNREHTWPNSKGDASGNGENDIMMLRPASVSENSSRGNKAYGPTTDSNYYNPNSEGQNVRGDCARILLYVYTRWGNTEKMWGSSGVIKSLDILLQWMEDDPVDTWEMGRNDAVQSITGTRNVFVDYPEYAWMLFGKSVPQNMTTPSGKASGGVVVNPPVEETCTHTFGAWTVVTAATVDATGLQKRTCSKCNAEETQVIPKLGMEDCTHTFGEWVEVKPATQAETGLKKRVCGDCGYEETQTIARICNHRFGDWTVVTPATEKTDGLQKHICRYCGYEETETIARLCKHRFGDWTVEVEATSETEGLQKHMCRYCGYEETEVIAKLGEETEDGCSSVVGLPIIGLVVFTCGGLVLKRKNDAE